MSDESDMDAYKILEAETLEPKDNPVKKKVEIVSEKSEEDSMMDKNSENAEQVEEIIQEIKENKDEKLGASTTLGASTLKETKKITP